MLMVMGRSRLKVKLVIWGSFAAQSLSLAIFFGGDLGYEKDIQDD